MDALFHHLSVVAELVLIISIITVFFKRQIRLSLKFSLPLLVVIFFSIAGCYYPLKTLMGGGESFQAVYSIYTLCLITLFLAWLFKENIFVSLFVVFAARNYLDGINLIADFTGYYLTYTSGRISSPITFMCQIILYTVSAPILYSIFKAYIQPAIKNTHSMDIWVYIWILPISFYFIYRLGVTPFYYSNLPDLYENPFLFPIAWLIAMFFCQLAVIKLLGETSQNIILKEKLHSAELLSEMEKKQYSLLQEYQEETRKIRHDLRHHLVAIRGYLEREDGEGSKRYIDQYLNQTDHYQMKRYCGNYAVDSIISYYEEAACADKIPTAVKISLPSVLPLPEVDFCTILGNLLSNAVEACQRQSPTEDRFIRINLQLTGISMIALSVTNSYSGEIREEGGVFLSSHHPDEGIGIMSVRHIAEQYNSIINFRYENGIFEASILMNPML